MVTFIAASHSALSMSQTKTAPELACQAGDVLIAVAAGSDTGITNETTPAVTPPDGTWTRIGLRGSGTRIEVFVKTATGPLAATTWTWPKNHFTVVGLLAYRNTTAPTTMSTAGAWGTSLPTPAVTVPTGGLAILCAYAHNGGPGQFAAGPTTRVDVDYQTFGNFAVAEATTGSSVTYSNAGTASATVLTGALVLPHTPSGGDPDPEPPATPPLRMFDGTTWHPLAAYRAATTTTPPEPEPNPPPAPTPPAGRAMASPAAIFSPTAWMNKQLATNEPVHHSSAAIIANLIAQGEQHYGSPGNPSVTLEMQAYSTGLATVQPGDPTPTITKPGDANGTALAVGQRVPPAVPIPNGSDGNVCFHDPARGELFDAWIFKEAGNGYTAEQLGRKAGVSTWDGRYNGSLQGRGNNAAGITMAAFVIRIHELLGSNGNLSCGCPDIGHVIGWGIPQLYGGLDSRGWKSYSYPAARSDGRNTTDPHARLWMGQLARLPAGVDVHTIATKPLQRILLHAVQRYGVIATDTSGAIGFGGENPEIDPTGWGQIQSQILGGRQVWQEMTGFPLHQLVALARKTDAGAYDLNL